MRWWHDRKPRRIDWLHIVAMIALVFVTGMLLVALFDPGLPYLVSNPRGEALGSDQFYRTVAVLTDAGTTENNRLEVLTNGENYYRAELDAIRAARRTICLEAYIFTDGQVQRTFTDALVDRARSGVRVNVVVDAVGSHDLPDSEVQRLKNAGVNFAWYMPLKWYTWPRMNNRTHRELLIIDGKVAFLGGAGWGDHWLYSQRKDQTRWRDTMVRVEGPVVPSLISTFAENWLESSGQVLTGSDYFVFNQLPPGRSRAIAVCSSPTTGRSSTARVLFQVLLASARKRIYITTPYFLPDATISDEMVHAIKERGVEVKIVTPGPGSDHMLTRRSSRRLFGPLLEAGAKIYEYQPSMIHAKVLMVDDLWSVVGSTNMDPRSFSLNDEVNLATPDAEITKRMEQDFFADLKQSREVSYEEWLHRGIAERIHELFGGLLQKQQ
jgi:cardiolipin synthase